MYLLLVSLFRLSSVSVVFDFNASLNDLAPVSPMLFPVVVKRKEKSDLLMDVFCVFFLLSSRLKSNAVSVLFDFSASLNDVALFSPTPVSVVHKGIASPLIHFYSGKCGVFVLMTNLQR